MHLPLKVVPLGTHTNATTLAQVRDRLVADGADPVGSSPEEFAAYIRSESVKWAKVVTDVGIKPE